jgi:hypothetical protein
VGEAAPQTSDDRCCERVAEGGRVDDDGQRVAPRGLEEERSDAGRDDA